jgi:1-acyl-sn-glycerol-3-phosphate acyltransferase
LQYAAKKSLFLIPFMGWLSRWGFGFVPIDRGNRKSALKSLEILAHSINDEGNSVSLSPEGTRSKDGLLSEFKKGPFYLRDDTKKNVVPAIVFGAYECWPPGRLFATPGKVGSARSPFVFASLFVLTRMTMYNAVFHRPSCVSCHSSRRILP